MVLAATKSQHTIQNMLKQNRRRNSKQLQKKTESAKNIRRIKKQVSHMKKYKTMKNMKSKLEKCHLKKKTHEQNTLHRSIFSNTTKVETHCGLRHAPPPMYLCWPHLWHKLQVLQQWRTSQRLLSHTSSSGGAAWIKGVCA